MRIRDENAGNDDQSRQRSRFQRHCQALNDVGAVAGDGRRSDRPYGAEIGAGVVFGDPDDQAGYYQAYDRADIQRLACEGRAGDRAHADQVVGDKPDGDEREYRRGDKARRALP